MAREFPGGVTPENPGKLGRPVLDDPMDGPSRPVTPGRDWGFKGEPGRELPRPIDPDKVPDEPGRPPVGGPPPTTNPGEWERPPAPPDENKGQPPPPDDGGIPGTGGDFSKGQVRNEPMGTTNPGEDFYGSGRGFQPYFGKDKGLGGRGQASSYDPLGIGSDAYMDPNADVWAMEGANSVLNPGMNAKPRYGLVGGQGGYGIGMVGQDYTGPLFDDAKDVTKAIRRQRRKLNQATRAVSLDPNNQIDGGTGEATGGGEMDYKGQPTGGGGAAGGGGAGGTGGGGKPGQPPAPGPSPTPNTAALGNALSTTGNYNSAATTPGSETIRGFFDTPWGRLTTASGGNPNVYKLQGGDESRLFHYDPRAVGQDGPGAKAGWKHMTADEYRGYGDYNYADPYAAGAQGAVKQQFQRTNVPAHLR